jgi:hypothetical protein
MVNQKLDMAIALMEDRQRSAAPSAEVHDFLEAIEEVRDEGSTQKAAEQGPDAITPH